MKRYLINLSVFFIPALLLLELRTRNFQGQYAQKAEGLVTFKDSIEILIVGNSHANDNIVPQEFDLFAYNAAFGSQSLYFDKRITLKYLNQLPKLRYVLISFECSSLYRLHRSSRDKFYHYYYGIDFKGQRFLKEDISYFFFGYMPKYAIQHIFESPEQLVQGWAGQIGHDTGMLTDEAIEARASYFNDLASNNEVLREEILQDLEDFVKQLIAHGIQPIFISNPVHKDLLASLDEKLLSRNEEDLSYLLHKYKLPYGNYLRAEFEDMEYFNVDHLNADGARRFSKMLNEFILDLERN